jgi:hypothetical protein
LTQRQQEAKKLKQKELNKDNEFMNDEKERYLSRLANVADLISSSESEPDDSDENFDVSQHTPESDSASSEPSLVPSSQISDVIADESSLMSVDQNSYVAEESFVNELSSKKKRVIDSSEGTLWSGARKKKAI